MKKLFLLCFLTVLLSNCDGNDDLEPVAIDCTVVACTNEFVTLAVTVTDKDGVLIPLDRFEVIDSKTLEDITPELSSEEFQTARQNGQYPIYSDFFLSGNQNTKRPLTFRGFINEEVLAESDYVIDTNCCHVSVVVGDTNITID